MLLKLSEHISNCLEHAAIAEERAAEAKDASARSDHESLARSWRHLAKSYQFVESLDHFLADTARGNNDGDAAPPELLTAIGEQPASPQAKVAIPRRRVKHEVSFNDRLLKSAQDAREQAALLSAGPVRERLLRKAQQSETAAGIDKWLSSPGAPSPDSFGFMKKLKT